MKGKKISAGLAALAVAVTSLVTMAYAEAPEQDDKVGVGRTWLAEGETLTFGETGAETGTASVVDGVLKLSGTMTITETPENSADGIWGAIAPRRNQPLNIELAPDADVTLVSSSSSGLYGYYNSVSISGSGKMTIDVSGSAKGIIIYSTAGTYGLTVTDGADVTVRGTAGIDFQNTKDGNIYVTDGGTLTVDAAGDAFAKAPVIQDGSTVWIKKADGTEAEWTKDSGTDLAAQPYVRIESRKYPKSVGIQEADAENAVWLYDGHDYPSGSDAAVHYDAGTGVLDFNRDIELRGVTYSGYYGSGIAPDPISAGKALTIRLNNNACVTIDATKDRNTASFLYGLYTTGRLTIEGSGTLKITSSGGMSDSAALCVYSNTYRAEKAGLTVKGDVELILENTETFGYGLNVYGGEAGEISIEDNASVEMTGNTQAVNKIPVISENHKVYAGDSADTAEEIAVSGIAAQKYVRISAEKTAPAAIEAEQARLAGEAGSITINENGEAKVGDETVSAWSLTSDDAGVFESGTVTAELTTGETSSAEVDGINANVEGAAKVYVLVNRAFDAIASVIFTPAG